MTIIVAPFDPATATDAQLEQGREIIMSCFWQCNTGKQDWFTEAAMKIMRKHKVEIGNEQRRRKWNQ